ncbi:hypothetical protein ACFV1A_21635 [Streptomyces seoulensis]|nr:hypothetical protein [Streptomyces seoulensis]
MARSPFAQAGAEQPGAQVGEEGFLHDAAEAPALGEGGVSEVGGEAGE